MKIILNFLRNCIFISMQKIWHDFKTRKYLHIDSLLTEEQNYIILTFSVVDFCFLLFCVILQSLSKYFLSCVISSLTFTFPINMELDCINIYRQGEQREIYLFRIQKYFIVLLLAKQKMCLQDIIFFFSYKLNYIVNGSFFIFIE